MVETCRCCLSSEAKEYIFNTVENVEGEKFSYSNMISACSSFEVKQNDGLPNKICKKCVGDLEIAHNFRLKCDKTYRTLLSCKSNILILVDAKEIPEHYIDQTNIANADSIPLVDNCKEEKDIKQEYDELSIEGPLSGFDCDMGDDNFTSELDADDSIKEDVKDEPTVDIEHPIVRMSRNGRIKKIKVKKDIKIKIKLCSVCSQSFTRKIELRRHMDSAHPEIVQEKYFCEICQKHYRDERRHQYFHKSNLPNGSKNFECSECNQTFSKIWNLTNHMKIHSETRSYTCKECGATFKQYAALYKHSKYQHSEKKYFCEFCSKSFRKKYTLTVHLRTHTKEKPFECPVCNEGFPTGNARNVHLVKHSDEELSKDSLSAFLELKLSIIGKRKKVDNSNLVCPHCSKMFRRSSDLTDHVNKHLGIKTHFCEICQKYCTSERKHREVHNKNRKRCCEICNKVFASQQSLRIHVSIHDTARPFVCPLCGASFKQNAALYRHKALHGDRSFICQYCSKLFSTKYKLEIHMRIHTKERPFACDMCPKKFYTGNLLKIHKQRHSDYKGLLCDLCDKSFKTRCDLRQHLRVHEKIRKYPCKICNKNFFRSDHRNRHETTVHSMENVKHENDESC